MLKALREKGCRVLRRKREKDVILFFGTFRLCELVIPEAGKGEGGAPICAFFCFLRDFGCLVREESHTYAVFWLSVCRHVTMPVCIFGA